MASCDLQDESGASIWDSALCLGEMLARQQSLGRASAGARVLRSSLPDYVGFMYLEQPHGNHWESKHSGLLLARGSSSLVLELDMLGLSQQHKDIEPQ